MKGTIKITVALKDIMKLEQDIMKKLHECRKARRAAI